MEILSGKDKGKQGRVSVVARKLNKVIVEGLNTVSYGTKLTLCSSHEIAFGFPTSPPRAGTTGPVGRILYCIGAANCMSLSILAKRSN